MKILKITLGTIAFVVIAALLFPLVYPINLYIPQVEASLRNQLHQPVSIGDMSVAYAPMPRLVLNNVRIGQNQEANISKVLVQPAYLSLLADRKVISRLSLDTAELRQEFVLIAPVIMNAGKDNKGWRVEAMSFSNSTIHLNKASLGPLNAEVSFDKLGGFKDILLSQEGTNAKLRIAPDGEQYAFSFDADNWAIPMAPSVNFSSLVVNAKGNADNVVFDDIRGVLYGGTMTASAKLEWRDGWQLSGRYDVNNMQLEPLTSGLNPKTFISGRASVEGVFGSSGKYLEDLLAHPRAEGKFKAEDGTLNNIDFITAIRYNYGANGGGLRGGKTRFDSMSGTIEISEKTYRFKNIALQSGLLGASGAVTVDAKQRVNGNLALRMKSAVNPMAVPMIVNGPLESPLLTPAANLRSSRDETNSGFSASEPAQQ